MSKDLGVAADAARAASPSGLSPSGSSRSGIANAVWLPIETAPKDGRDILLAGWFGVRIGNWGPYGRYHRKAKVFDGVLSNFERAWSEERPTHWMELPAPPES